MPIYDYRCDHCGHAFSAVQSFNDEPIDKCPNCGKKPRRLIVAPAVVFKGSGWYSTDSRGKPPKESDSTASGDHKSESSPAAKETHTEAKGTKTSPESSSGGKSEAKS
ncbi:MAG TPA: FmdB family zinc ribbon protein [Candidatus Limnocylindria bacterium]|nr:FmdB family zinc ribbon protein [Candidatus Limnocylindria bacterium]